MCASWNYSDNSKRISNNSKVFDFFDEKRGCCINDKNKLCVRKKRGNACSFGVQTRTEYLELIIFWVVSCVCFGVSLYVSNVRNFYKFLSTLKKIYISVDADFIERFMKTIETIK